MAPYPDLTDAELRAQLDLLPTWVLAQKAAANRQVIAVLRGRLERGEAVARMYGPLGLACLQRQAEIAEQRSRRAPPASSNALTPHAGARSAQDPVSALLPNGAQTIAAP